MLEIPVEYMSSPILQDAEVTGAEATFKDITEREASSSCTIKRSTILSPGYQTGRIAVLFVDLDDFEVINDKLGHKVGDHALKAVAERVRIYPRPEDTGSS